ncbi:alpha/beta fold hydrolase [Devosia soli]|uniref:alpha/beta fold hydrolase n=1 Tax=Devosia soli TaxID=361041 RepID=UPI000AE9B9C2|nr:alpha/beta fold hydrolase [Devosia soli]
MGREIERQHAPAGHGTSIFYRLYPARSPERGAVILVHGLASSGIQFDAEAKRFAAQGYRVLVPDLRGHGETGAPRQPIRIEDYSIPTLAADMLALLDHAGVESVHWVGNSLGGILALSLLGTPAKARIKTLAIFGTCFALDLPSPVVSLVKMVFLPGAARTAPLVARTTTINPRGQRAIVEAIKQFDAGAGAAIAAHVRRYDFTAIALAFRAPLLVLQGGKDHAVNLALNKQLVQFMPRANFTHVVLPRGGHCANFDMHDEFCAALETHWARAAAF